MRKINRQDVARTVMVLLLVAGVALAADSVGRFSPSHKIVQPVYCAQCHPEQFEELTETTHLAGFVNNLKRATDVANPGLEEPIKNETLISAACTMCHNNWDNFQEYGLGDFYLKYDASAGTNLAKNAKVVMWNFGNVKTATPSPNKGNITVKLTNLSDPVAGDINAVVKIWLENYKGQNTDTYGEFTVVATGVGNVTFNTGNSTGSPYLTIVDALGPPIYGDYFNFSNTNNAGSPLQENVSSIYGKKDYLSTAKDEYVFVVNATKTVTTDSLLKQPFALHTTFLYEVTRMDAVWGNQSKNSPTPGIYYSTYGNPDPAKTDSYSRPATCGNVEKGGCHAAVSAVALSELGKMPEFPASKVNGVSAYGANVFFKHEMAYTTADYAAKSVKLCAACHVNKLPPMTDEGIPIGTSEELVISAHGSPIVIDEVESPANWAHQQVACIRCHAHAGINEEK